MSLSPIVTSIVCQAAELCTAQITSGFWDAACAVMYTALQLLQIALHAVNIKHNPNAVASHQHRSLANINQLIDLRQLAS
jgi:hypothetical protein